MSDLPPLPNDPAARTPTGELLDAQTPSPTTPPISSTEPPIDPAAPAVPAKPDIPETYTFRAPEGQELDKDLLAAATPVFKELGLTQAQADKLVELQYKLAKTDADRTTSAIQVMGKTWADATMADPELGPNIDKIKLDVGRALETVLTPAERAKFQSSMDQTMIGNNPDFVRTFWKLAQKLAPGSHITGGGPSPHGQNPNGNANTRPSIADALYPRAS